MQLEYNTTGGGGEYEDWTKRAWVPKYYNEDGFVLADSLGGRGLAQIVPFNGGSTATTSSLQAISVTRNTTSRGTGITMIPLLINMERKPKLQRIHGPSSPYSRLSRNSFTEKLKT